MTDWAGFAAPQSYLLSLTYGSRRAKPFSLRPTARARRSVGTVQRPGLNIVSSRFFFETTSVSPMLLKNGFRGNLAIASAQGY